MYFIILKDDIFSFLMIDEYNIFSVNVGSAFIVGQCSRSGYIYMYFQVWFSQIFGDLVSFSTQWMFFFFLRLNNYIFPFSLVTLLYMGSGTLNTGFNKLFAYKKSFLISFFFQISKCVGTLVKKNGTKQRNGQIINGYRII